MTGVSFTTLAALFESSGLLMVIAGIVIIIMFVLVVFAQQYKRCPSNRILVKYGRVGARQAAECIHGGATFVIPMLQSYAYLSLEPLTIDIDLTSALSKKNIRVNVPSTFTIGISTNPGIMNNAAERMLGLHEGDIKSQARDIILGQMRLVIATLSIEEINQDREKFLDLVNTNVNFELNKIGLEVINVNVRDILDESGYIEALGRKAAAEAINQAKIEVAEATRSGAIGEATAQRDMQVRVAEQVAQSSIGQKSAEREQRIRTAELEAQGISGEAESKRMQDVAIAEQEAVAVQGRKQAESSQRVRVAQLESEAVKGENESQAAIADYEATLSERRAEARRRGEVAAAQAARDVLMAERGQEEARLQKEQIVVQQIEKQKVEIDAEAEAERIRRLAQGEADGVLARYKAEADGIRQVLESKAIGYERLLAICGDQKQLAPTLLLLEKLPELVAEQVKAIQNLKIDKVTVWDSGAGHSGGNGEMTQGTTSTFLRSLMSSLPPMHELAQQAGIELPELLGRVRDDEGKRKSPAEAAATTGRPAKKMED